VTILNEIQFWTAKRLVIIEVFKVVVVGPFMIKYRREVDGLRSIAILPVILFHLGVPLFSGGFLGVDVFFVISGYLITSIILSDVAEKRFSVVDFYERRIRRLLPALFLVLSVTTLIFFIFYKRPDQYADYGASLLSVLFFISNIYFFTQSGYFGTASEATPLLHTWSLAVEEQFYVIFPLIVLMLYPERRKLFIALIVIGLLLSIGVSEWGHRNSPVGNFLLTPSRVWELMAGACSALALRYGYQNKVNERFRALLAISGLALILVSMLDFDEYTPHPGLMTLFPVGGAVLVILFATSTNIAGKLLGLKPAVYIGLISYSLYLWHQPILALAKEVYGHTLPYQVILSVILMVFLLSHVSWKYVEAPFRKTRFNRAQVFRFAIVGTSIFTVIGTALLLNENIQSVFRPTEMSRYQLLKTATLPENNQPFQNECIFWESTINRRFIDKFNTCSQKYGKGLIVTGGSHGIDLYNAFALNKPYPFIAGLSRGFCRIHNPVTPQKQGRCHYQDLDDFLDRNRSFVKRLVYTQTPDRLFANPMIGGSHSGLSINAVNEVVAYLTGVHNRYGIEVDMFGMLPLLVASPITMDVNTPLESQLLNLTYPKAFDDAGFVDSVFMLKFKGSRVRYFSKIDLFELVFPEDLMVDGEISYSDSRHISTAGEKVFGKRMISHLNSLGYFDSQ